MEPTELRHPDRIELVLLEPIKTEVGFFAKLAPTELLPVYVETAEEERVTDEKATTLEIAAATDRSKDREITSAIGTNCTRRDERTKPIDTIGGQPDPAEPGEIVSYQEKRCTPRLTTDHKGYVNERINTVTGRAFSVCRGCPSRGKHAYYQDKT